MVYVVVHIIIGKSVMCLIMLSNLYLILNRKIILRHFKHTLERYLMNVNKRIELDDVFIHITFVFSFN